MVVTMILGDLEKQVLNYLWTQGEADAKQVHADMSASRSGSLNTIQSTLDRLYKKKLLSRSKVGHAYRYRARVDRQELIAQLVCNVTHDFIEAGQSPLVAAFVSMSDQLNSAELDALEAMIDARRKQTQEGDS